MKRLFAGLAIATCIGTSYADVRELVDAGKIAWTGAPQVIYLNADGTTADVSAYDHLVLKFTDTETTGTLTIAEGVKGSARILVVGGGGAGGSGYGTGNNRGVGGGGGAGGMVETNDVRLAGGTYTAVVGAGGVADTPTEEPLPGGNGANSLFKSTTETIVEAFGGGGGGAESDGAGGAGLGSGGGGSLEYTTVATVHAGGVCSTGQGNNGGDGRYNRTAGGGGGAQSPGDVPAGNNRGANGGAGLPVDIIADENGDPITYAGGGGSGVRTGSEGGLGGAGGGGSGAGSSVEALPGEPNTGGGGGGGSLTLAGANGGSGVVIVRITQAIESKVIVPTLLNTVYTGENIVAPFDFGVAYEYVGGTTNAANAGKYEFTIRPGADREWSTGGTHATNVSWSITSAANTITALSLSGWKIGTTPNTPDIAATWGADTVQYQYGRGYMESSVLAWIDDPASLDRPGMYVVRAVIPATDNWLATKAVTTFSLWGDPTFTIESGVLSHVNLNGATEAVIPDGVTSIGWSAFEYCYDMTSVTIPSSVTNIGRMAFSHCFGLTNVTIPDGVTSIDDYALNCCISLTIVTIPDSVTNIGNGAFSYCSRLTSLTIPSSVTSIGKDAFRSCSGLESLKMTDGVVSIGDGAFYNCIGLTCVAIPDTVTRIGERAFASCGGITNFSVGAENESYMSRNGLLLSKDGNKLVQGINVAMEMVIPDSVTTIAAGAFEGCSSLTGVTIPNSVADIGEAAFAGCSGLVSVTIPESVTNIGLNAFSHCEGLADESGFVIVRDVLYGYYGEDAIVVIPDGVTNIGDWAFEYSDMTSVTIPNSVTNIGASAFEGCLGLTSVTIPDGVTSIGDNAFRLCRSLMSATISDGVTSIGYEAFSGCSSLTSVTIPSSITNIGEMAFFDCTCLTNVTIVAGVTSIGSFAFEKCGGLTSVTIPDSVTNIGRSAFEDCDGLTDVTIPSSVTNIGDMAFFACSGLTDIAFEGNAPDLGDEVFAGVDPSCVVHVNGVSTGWGVDVPGTWNGLMIEYAEGENPPSGGTKTASATSLDADPDNYTEGDVVHYRAALSAQNETGSAIYAFLLCNEDVDLAIFVGSGAKAIIKDTNVAAIGSAGLMISANGTYANGAFSVLNNGHYSFSVVLCTTRSYDPQYRLAGYDTTEKLGITVYNREPDFLTVYLNGFESESDGCTFPVQYLRGQVQTIQPEFDDVIYDLKHSFSYRWTASCGGRVVVDGLVMHDTTGTVTEIVSTNDSGEVTTIVPDGMNINEVPFVYNFPVPGVWSVSIQGKDCDMESYPDSSYTISFPVCDYPMIEVSAQDLYSEDDKTASIDVGLRYYEADEDIVVKLTVTPPEGTNPGAFVLDNAYKTVPIGYPALAENEYYLSFDTAQTISVRIASMDGTMRSESRGFAVKAEVVTSSDSGVPGKTWADIYVPSALKVYVGNVAPTLGYCTAENANAWMVAGGVATSFPIKWSIRSDVVPDFTNKWANGEGPGIKVSFRGCDNATTFYVTDTNDWSGTFIPDFGSCLGANNVTMSIEDKDDGMVTFVYLYDVETPKYTATVDDVVWVYENYGDTDARITGSQTVLTGNVVIPDAVNGRTVVAIAESALKNASGVTGITIPKSVVLIEDGAFAGLEEVLAQWYKSLADLVEGGSAYGIGSEAADQTIATITVDSDTTIGDFVLSKDKVYDSVIYIVNTADHEINITLPAGYTYKMFKGAKPLKVPANSESVLTITRLAENVFLVSAEELETMK